MPYGDTASTHAHVGRGLAAAWLICFILQAAGAGLQPFTSVLFGMARGICRTVIWNVLHASYCNCMHGDQVSSAFWGNDLLFTASSGCDSGHWSSTKVLLGADLLILLAKQLCSCFPFIT